MSLNEPKISENFNIRNYWRYETTNNELNAALQHQNHVDIRTFTKYSGEEWQSLSGTVTYGPQSSFSNYPGLSLKLKIGENSAKSEEVNGKKKFIDLATEFDPTRSYIIMSMPSLPSGVELTNSYLILNSETNGKTYSAKIKLSTKESSGNSLLDKVQFKILVSTISPEAGFDWHRIKDVILEIKSTESGVYFYAAGLRLVDKEWQYPGVDYDNINNVWRKTMPLDLSSGAYTKSKLFGSLPVLWRSTYPWSEIETPRPIDSSLSATFYTGELSEENALSIFMRGQLKNAFITQGTLNELEQKEIENKWSEQPQRGFVSSKLRPLSSVEEMKISELEERTIKSLETEAVSTGTSWIECVLNWGAHNKLSINATNGPSGINIGNFNLSMLASKTTYALIIVLKDTTISVEIYKVNSATKALEKTPIFKTGLITNNLLEREKGQLGWQAIINDPNSFVGNIQSRELLFAEYRSLPFKSYTPVAGANLYAASSPPIEKFSEFYTENNYTEIINDSSQTVSGRSKRIVFKAGSPGAFSTKPFELDNIGSAYVRFYLWLPNGFNGDLKVSLITNEKAFLNPESTEWGTIEVPLTLPALKYGSWQRISIPLTKLTALYGEYELLFYLEHEYVGNIWIDKIEIYENSIAWSARSIADNPWRSNYAPWTSFGDTSEGSAIAQFGKRGKELQIRAKALHQDARIESSPKVEPVYAQLGNFAWGEKELPASLPKAKFKGTRAGTELKVTGESTAVSSEQPIISWQWVWGDGTESYGDTIKTHIYADTKPYEVTLIIRDTYGFSSMVTVSV